MYDSDENAVGGQDTEWNWSSPSDETVNNSFDLVVEEIDQQGEVPVLEKETELPMATMTDERPMAAETSEDQEIEISQEELEPQLPAQEGEYLPALVHTSTTEAAEAEKSSVATESQDKEVHGITPADPVEFREDLSSESPLATLTDLDRQRLETCEQKVFQFYNSGVECGRALRIIRDERLYRVHGNFEKYVRERFDMSRAQAYRLIDAASVMDNLLQGGLSQTEDKNLPCVESHLRVLAKLNEPEAQCTAWNRVLDHAKTGRITTTLVSKVVREMEPEPVSSTRGTQARQNLGRKDSGDASRSEGTFSGPADTLPEADLHNTKSAESHGRDLNPSLDVRAEQVQSGMHARVAQLERELEEARDEIKKRDELIKKLKRLVNRLSQYAPQEIREKLVEKGLYLESSDSASGR